MPAAPGAAGTGRHADGARRPAAGGEPFGWAHGMRPHFEADPRSLRTACATPSGPRSRTTCAKTATSSCHWCVQTPHSLPLPLALLKRSSNNLRLLTPRVHSQLSQTTDAAGAGAGAAGASAAAGSTRATRLKESQPAACIRRPCEGAAGCDSFSSSILKSLTAATALPDGTLTFGGRMAGGGERF